jgi:predicted DNA-binding ArsR family transcriptional regulator
VSQKEEKERDIMKEIQDLAIKFYWIEVKINEMQELLNFANVIINNLVINNGEIRGLANQILQYVEQNKDYERFENDFVRIIKDHSDVMAQFVLFTKRFADVVGIFARNYNEIKETYDKLKKLGEQSAKGNTD